MTVMCRLCDPAKSFPSRQQLAAHRRKTHPEVLAKPEPETFAEGLTADQIAPGQEPYVDPDVTIDVGVSHIVPTPVRLVAEEPLVRLADAPFYVADEALVYLESEHGAEPVGFTVDFASGERCTKVAEGRWVSEPIPDDDITPDWQNTAVAAADQPGTMSPVNRESAHANIVGISPSRPVGDSSTDENFRLATPGRFQATPTIAEQTTGHVADLVGEDAADEEIWQSLEYRQLRNILTRARQGTFEYGDAKKLGVLVSVGFDAVRALERFDPQNPIVTVWNENLPR